MKLGATLTQFAYLINCQIIQVMFLDIKGDLTKLMDLIVPF
jgi:hypothetical protein